ncbi:hypothetical protein EPN42_07125 [bacterium]|nr:MAG: hypothetical protein EPN42_07125 [bacterium]
MRIHLMVFSSILVLAAGGIAAAQMTSAGLATERGMEQQNNSGQAGFVTLVERGEKTLVNIRLDGAPAGRVEPAHVHRGECPKINPAPAYPLNPVVNGRSTTLVNVPLSRLVSGNYSVNVHASAKNLTHYVSCGYLTPGT